jgi:hypothetical protein
MSDFTRVTDAPVVEYKSSQRIKAQNLVRQLRRDIERGAGTGHTQWRPKGPIPVDTELHQI